MTIHEAEILVRNFCSILGEADQDMWHSLSELPCSPAKIRYAFFIWAEHLVKTGEIYNELPNGMITGDALIINYGGIQLYRELASEMNEECNKLMKSAERYCEGDQKEYEKVLLEIRNFTAKHKLDDILQRYSRENEVEFHNFLADINGNYDPMKKATQGTFLD